MYSQRISNKMDIIANKTMINQQTSSMPLTFIVIPNSISRNTDEKQTVPTNYRPIRPLIQKDTDNEQSKILFIPSKQQALMCNTCGLKCKSKSQLKVHLLIHTGVKSHICKTCNKSFTREWHLHRHDEVHKRKEHYRPKTKRKTKCKIKSDQAENVIKIQNLLEIELLSLKP